ncbi:MAG: type II toxin-antitoxin system RelE/ParE family toxin [Pseudomonadota bacterium]
MAEPIDNFQNVLFKGQVYQLRTTLLFTKWLEKQKDRVSLARILARLLRLADGKFGDVKAVGDGVVELRMHFGPGYRVYVKQRGDVVILLLIGGDKGSQKSDIEKARALARQDSDDIEDDAF